MVAVASKKSPRQVVFSSLWMLLGAFIAAFSLEVFLIPNNIIDGGVIGVSILLSSYLGQGYTYPLVVILNLPFIYLAFRYISRTMVIQMLIALTAFAILGQWIGHSDMNIFQPYRGDLLEIVVVGGLLLGFGVGLIIRSGGCLDGTEILGLLVNKKIRA